MKIMRRDSWARGFAGAPGCATIAHGRTSRCGSHRKETSMQWQTPQAVDFRFGFEITMYVSAR